MTSRYGRPEFLDRFWGVNRRENMRRGMAMTPASPQHMTWDDISGQIDPAPDLSFGVVRDPLARLRSEYAHQHRSPYLFRRLLAWGSSFSLWTRVALLAARENPYIFDSHIRPQADFLPSDARVFRFEDGLDKVVTWIDQIAPVEGGLDHMPHSLPSRKLRRKPDLGPEELALVADFYAKDYASFGYEIPVLPVDVTSRHKAGLDQKYAQWLAQRVLSLYPSARI